MEPRTIRSRPRLLHNDRSGPRLAGFRSTVLLPTEPVELLDAFVVAVL